MSAELGSIAKALGEHSIANLETPKDRVWVRPYSPQPRPCPWCKRSFVATRRDQSYCSTRCGSKAFDRETQRARWVYRSLYWWYKTRKPEHLTAVLKFLKLWATNDEQEGKGPPAEPEYTIPWTSRQPRKASRGELHLVDLWVRADELLDKDH